MKLTGAAILVSRGMKVLQAAPAAYPYRSAARFPMRKRLWIIGSLLFVSLALATSAFWLLRDGTPALRRRVQIVPPEIEPLRDQQDLVGEWNRVEFPDAVIPVNWRKFSATGDFRVCYGDVIHWGTYRFVDDKTVETVQGHSGEVNRWTVGRSDGKLVLIHPKNGWVEQYVSVPVGTLQP